MQKILFAFLLFIANAGIAQTIVTVCDLSNDTTGQKYAGQVLTIRAKAVNILDLDTLTSFNLRDNGCDYPVSIRQGGLGLKEDTPVVVTGHQSKNRAGFNIIAADSVTRQ